MDPSEAVLEKARSGEGIRAEEMMSGQECFLHKSIPSAFRSAATVVGNQHILKVLKGRQVVFPAGVKRVRTNRWCRMG